MSETTTVSIEVEFIEQGYVYRFKTPAGVLSYPMFDKTPEGRMKLALKEVQRLLRTCEDLAAQEALREKQEIEKK